MKWNSLKNIMLVVLLLGIPQLFLGFGQYAFYMIGILIVILLMVIVELLTIQKGNE